MNFVSGGSQAGTLAESAGPPRPPGIPEHYVFDTEVELWMAPNAIKAAAAVKAVAGPEDNGLQVIKSTSHPYQNPTNSNEPICFEYTNTGACGRLTRGEQCRYRHLEPTHPDVVADRVKQGKLPPIALEYAVMGDVVAVQNIMAGREPKVSAAEAAAAAVAAATGGMPPKLPSASLLPGQSEGELPDPGPSVNLCFDFINNGSCMRLRTGQTCKYRHLPPNHPDVLADKVKNGKLTAHQAQEMMNNPQLDGAYAAPGVGAAQIPGLPPGVVLPNMPNIPAMPNMPGLPNMLSAGVTAPMMAGVDPLAAAAMNVAMPDPGPGTQLCFDFINRGICSRLQRGENCRYRHLPPTHPDVVADKIRQGKAPGALPTPPMGNYVNTLAQLGACAHGMAGMPGMPPVVGVPGMMAGAVAGMNNPPKMTMPPVGSTSARKRRDSSPESDDSGERFRARDRERNRRYDGGRHDDRRGGGYDRGRYDDRRYDSGRDRHGGRDRRDDRYDDRRGGCER